MTYLPKTKAGQEIHVLMGELSSAQHQWNTYATQVGRGYTTAYGWHDDTVKKVQERLRLAAESAYWLLSLLCVSFAGGLVGGLMAPWVSRAGSMTARTMLSETMQSQAQSITQKGLEQTRPGESPFRPALKSPLQYWQDMQGEIGLCFSALRGAVEEWMKKVDNDPRASTPSAVINEFMQKPLLKDAPKDEDMPDETKVAREAELGMWIAWAQVRDIDYWKERINRVTDRGRGPESSLNGGVSVVSTSRRSTNGARSCGRRNGNCQALARFNARR